ncbi:DnaJ domain-containing protein [Nesterenkonia sp. NBAIMH1]|uniref:J domain-containing protein n=1 Tax=Nesterenkonia sp. NBAIMH1 TaxID=2600320 RepID=UPI0011B4649F|nr:DnaJ domain-containing protein [Nesterenkonia sp. NBAIMH1]
MNEPDHYTVLGVEPGDDFKTLRAAYRRRLRQTHPDAGGTAEAFHEVQLAWEVLGDEDARADYDADMYGPAPEREPAPRPAAERDRSAAHYEPAAEADQGLYTPQSFSSRGSAANTGSSEPAGQDRARRGGTDVADLAVEYFPSLKEPQPLPLQLTSQRMHGTFKRSGLFGGGAAKRGSRVAALLEAHVFPRVPAARLFNDVYEAAVQVDRRGRAKPTSSDRVPHVLICGHRLVVVEALEIGGEAAAWDGGQLHAHGRSHSVPNLQAEARRLRGAVQEAMRATASSVPTLRVDYQVILLSPSDDLFKPLVQTVGGASDLDAPVPAARAFRQITDLLTDQEQPNLVDRHLMAALRRQLVQPDEI